MEDHILKTSKFQYSTCGSDFESATPEKPDLRCDLMTFLGVAQKLEIDFLPITWQPALDRIGRGATAEIREAFMTLQASFAFKRPIFQSSFDFDEVESRILPSLIAEISILGHPSIRQHPNIIQLEGICWEVLSGEGESVSRQRPIISGKGGIVPVLVFEKTNHGDLRSFMMHDTGKQLGFTERLQMCTAVAKAVADMHLNNIVHGDIKPQNTLIFEDTPGGYTAKVADFGYSTQYAMPNDLIFMPRSRPWAAPEWHHRGFTPAEASKMDSYSFGMLVLWLLCYSTQEDSDSKFISDLSAVSGALALALEVIQLASQNQQVDLIQYFNETLTSDVATRCSDFRRLQCILAPERTVSGARTGRSSEYLDLTGVTFLMIPSMFQFYENDYRVRLYLADCFLKRMSDLEDRQDHDLTSQNILLQCAFCYEIGFGTARDSTRSHKLLEKCKKYEMDFYHELNSFRHGNYSLSSRESLYRRMRKKGHIQMIDLPQTYHGLQSLDKVELEYRREITDVESGLGHGHRVVDLLKSQLSSIFSQHGQWDEAEQLDVQVVEMRKRLLGEKHPDTLTSISNLAAVYKSQGRYEEAKGLETQVTEERKSILGEKHPDTLNGMANLISIYGDEGQLERAEELQMQVIKTSTRVLGQEHPNTLKFMADLVETYMNQERWTEAEELDIRVVEAEKRLLGNEHPRTLFSILHLISIYRFQGRWEEAEELDLKALTTTNKILEKKDPATLTSMANLASVYRSQKRWKDVEELELQIIDTTKSVSGEEHVDTLSSIGQLASTYKAQGRWKEAEELDLYVVNAEKKILGEEHPDTLISMMNLASTYRNQRMWKETEELDMQVIETRKRVLGEEHPDTLTSISNLAVTYWYQKRWTEAVDLEVQVMETTKKLLGDGHPSTLISMANLAQTYLYQGQTSKAVYLMTEVARRRAETLGSDHPDTVVAQDTLEGWRNEDTVVT